MTALLTVFSDHARMHKIASYHQPHNTRQLVVNNSYWKLKCLDQTTARLVRFF